MSSIFNLVLRFTKRMHVKHQLSSALFAKQCVSFYQKINLILPFLISNSKIGKSEVSCFLSKVFLYVCIRSLKAEELKALKSYCKL